MRIWNEQLIPILCQKHLCAMWREGLGALRILWDKQDSPYRNHPAIKEFKTYRGCCVLWERMYLVREEMLRRGYHPKKMPSHGWLNAAEAEPVKEWQSLEQQIEVIKQKQLKGFCKCELGKLNTKKAVV